MDNETNIPRRHRQEKEVDKRFKLRNILNLIFILGAIAGMLFYFLSDETVGIIIIMAAMVFKLTECCLRFFH